ncbi:hypothetical protein AB0N93_20060 [Streptomyces sp. NPDC091267]|uniref:hypothetical protein n=1 Tax=Streptomyces sp. NPDC091267 TaxID=3155195 RepID=UPI003424896F
MDLLFTAEGTNIAVLIDPGSGSDQHPGRQLRLTHACGEPLAGLPSGGAGAKARPVTRTIRVPAWRILVGESVLEPLFS